MYNIEEQLKEIAVERKIKLEEMLDEEGVQTADIYQMYADMLDEIYGEISVCGLKYAASALLLRIDDIAFRCGLDDWLDNECVDARLVELKETGDFYHVDELQAIIDKADEKESE